MGRRTWRTTGHGVVACALGIAVLAACGSDDDACDLEIPAEDAPADGTVTYRVEVRGDATVSVIEYTGPEGTETVDDPDLPFEVEVEVEEGDELSLVASGSTEGSGSVSAVMSFVDVDGVDPEQTRVSCGDDDD